MRILNFSLLLFLFSFGCQSRSTSSFSKATRESPRPSRVELESVTNSSGRSTTELENAVWLNAGVQNCLRAALIEKPHGFVLSLSGQVSAAGEFQNLQVTALEPILNSCLRGRISLLLLGYGPVGSFQMHLKQVLPGSVKSKTLLLDLNPTQRLQ